LLNLIIRKIRGYAFFCGFVRHFDFKTEVSGELTVDLFGKVQKYPLIITSAPTLCLID
jgi:hypothetical protein